MERSVSVRAGWWRGADQQYRRATRALLPELPSRDRGVAFGSSLWGPGVEVKKGPLGEAYLGARGLPGVHNVADDASRTELEMLEVGKGIEIVLVSVNRVYVLVAQVYRLSATRGGCDRREQGATFWREEKKLGMEFELAWPLTSSSISHLLSHLLTCTPSPIKVPHSRHLATHHNSLFLRPFFLFQYDPPSQLHTMRALPPCAMSWRHRYRPSHQHHDLYFLPYFLSDQLPLHVESPGQDASKIPGIETSLEL